MVPCLRVSDGREGLYDLVDGVFTAILYQNIISISDSALTSTYPVASDLTVGVGRVGATATITFPKGSGPIAVSNKYYGVYSVTPTYDDLYYYVPANNK